MFRTGLINQIYTVNGQKITDIQFLEQNHCYVLVSASDPFIRTRYNINDNNVYGLKNSHPEAMQRPLSSHLSRPPFQGKPDPAVETMHGNNRISRSPLSKEINYS